MRERTIAPLRAVVVLASLTLAACSSSAPPGVAISPSAAAPAPLPTSPLASAPALLVQDLTTPAYPPERSSGQLAFVIDSQLGAVYEFDLGLHRFLGPAPRLAGIGRLPGFPYVLGRFAPQGAVVDDGTLYVADGDDGSVTAMKVAPDGLSQRRTIALPSFNLIFPQSEGGGSGPMRSRFIDSMVPFGPARMLVLGKDRISGIGIAYSIDSATGSAAGSLQLPFGYAQAAATGGGRTVVAMDGKRLLVMADDPLRITTTIPLDGVPHGVAIVGHSAFVAVDQPARLLRVDLDNGATQTVDRAVPASTSSSHLAGPVAADEMHVWWTIKTGEVRQVAISGGYTRSFQTFKYVNGLALAGSTLLVTCLERAQLALIDLGNGRVLSTQAGSFPSAVAVAQEP